MKIVIKNKNRDEYDEYLGVFNKRKSLLINPKKKVLPFTKSLKNNMLLDIFLISAISIEELFIEHDRLNIILLVLLFLVFVVLIVILIISNKQINNYINNNSDINIDITRKEIKYIDRIILFNDIKYILVKNYSIYFIPKIPSYIIFIPIINESKITKFLKDNNLINKLVDNNK